MRRPEIGVLYLIFGKLDAAAARKRVGLIIDLRVPVLRDVRGESRLDNWCRWHRCYHYNG